MVILTVENFIKIYGQTGNRYVPSVCIYIYILYIRVCIYIYIYIYIYYYNNNNNNNNNIIIYIFFFSFLCKLSELVWSTEANKQTCLTYRKASVLGHSSRLPLCFQTRTPVIGPAGVGRGVGPSPYTRTEWDNSWGCWISSAPPLLFVFPSYISKRHIHTHISHQHTTKQYLGLLWLPCFTLYWPWDF